MDVSTFRKQPGHWLDVRRRGLGMWAYVLNRVTGLGLVFYLYLHLATLSRLAIGPQAWDDFVGLARSPAFLSLDVLLLAGLLIHGLNGLRVTLTGLGVAVRAQRALFVATLLGAAVLLVLGALGIFGA